MNNNNSTPPQFDNPKPAGNAFLAGLYAQPVAPPAVTEAEAKRQKAAVVVARFRAWARPFDPDCDDGNFVTWDDFAYYHGEAGARRTEAGWYRDQIGYAMRPPGGPLGGCGLTDDERAIVSAAFPGDAWQPPASRRWVSFEDTERRAPINLPDDDDHQWEAAARDFAAAYRADLPKPMRELGMVLGLAPGAPVYVAAWLGKEQTPRQIDSWLRYVDPHDDDNRRFRAVNAPPPHAFRGRVELEPVRAVAAANLDALRTPARAAGGKTPTGIDGLDQLIRLGGTEPGGLVVFVAREKNCKTLSMLQVAEHRTARGRRGVWIARDEPEASIQKRRWQYRGCSEADAEMRVARGDVVNDALVVSADGIDKVLATVTELARSGLVDVYLDSLNGDATGQHEIDDLVRRLKATGADIFTTAEGTAGKDPVRVKGSTGVAFKADLTVALRYKKADGVETLTMRVARSRIANDGEVTVTVDTAGQRFAPAPADRNNGRSVSQADAADDDAIAEVLAALLDAGVPLGSAQLTTRIPRRKTEVLAALKRALDGGSVVRHDGKYALGT